MRTHKCRFILEFDIKTKDKEILTYDSLTEFKKELKDSVEWGLFLGDDGEYERDRSPSNIKVRYEMVKAK